MQSKNDVVKKDLYNAKIKNIEDQILDITNSATNTTLNGSPKVKGEIPSITNLATTAAPTIVENKIPNVSDPVKKVDYSSKIPEMKIKYFNTSDYNKFTSDTLHAKITRKHQLMNLI